MKSVLSRALCLSFAFGFSGSALAIGQEGDTRVQANGSLTLANEGDDTIIAALQFQRYASDTLVLGGYFSLTESGGFSFTTVGVTAKAVFPSQTEAVPYVGAAGLLFSSDFDDEFVFSVSAGVDIYVDENFGYNFDATQGLTDDFYEDMILSFGAFYEF